MLAKLSPCRVLLLASVSCQAQNVYEQTESSEPTLIHTETVADSSDIANEQIQTTWSIGVSKGIKVKVEGEIESYGPEQLETEPSNEKPAIVLPSIVVQSVHARSIKKGLCFRDRETEQVSCLCHPDNYGKYPEVELTQRRYYQSSAKQGSDPETETLLLGSAEYLGTPFLLDY